MNVNLKLHVEDQQKSHTLAGKFIANCYGKFQYSYVSGQLLLEFSTSRPCREILTEILSVTAGVAEILSMDISSETMSDKTVRNCPDVMPEGIPDMDEIEEYFDRCSLCQQYDAGFCNKYQVQANTVEACTIPYE